jgi:hypothetical protein
LLELNAEAELIAAIYASKSTAQFGTADEQKSVALQIEHAPGFLS